MISGQVSTAGPARRLTKQVPVGNPCTPQLENVSFSRSLWVLEWLVLCPLINLSLNP